MKTITIFLASSKELSDDRDAIALFINGKLNSVYKPYGFDVKLLRFEDMTDTEAYNGERTQDMYNRSVWKSDLLVALFYTKAGKHTLEEIDNAKRSWKENRKPKICVYYKFLDDKTKETSEIKCFKDEVLKIWEYYTVPD